MYCTVISKKKNKIAIQCNWDKSKTSLQGRGFTRVDAIYDTGAPYTCITAISLDPKLTEDKFSNADVLNVAGLVDSYNAVTYYKLHVRDFYFGNIHIAGVDIWVTFDERVTDNVVGMDVISRIHHLGIAYSGQEVFFKDIAEMKNYVASIPEGETVTEYLSTLS